MFKYLRSGNKTLFMLLKWRPWKIRSYYRYTSYRQDLFEWKLQSHLHSLTSFVPSNSMEKSYILKTKYSFKMKDNYLRSSTENKWVVAFTNSLLLQQKFLSVRFKELVSVIAVWLPGLCDCPSFCVVSFSHLAFNSSKHFILFTL